MLSLVRAVAGALVLSGVTALGTVAVPVAAHAAASSGGVKTSKSCRMDSYKSHYTIVSATKKPAITHLSTYGIGPSGSHKVTKTAAYSSTVSTDYHFSSNVTAESGGLAKVIAKASATVGFELRKTKGHTSSKSTTVEDYVSNNTNRNVQYVFYAGVTHAYGAFRWYKCVFYYVNGQNYGYARVTYYPGRWSSYAIPGEGAVRCGSSKKGLGALARAALSVGCKA